MTILKWFQDSRESSSALSRHLNVGVSPGTKLNNFLYFRRAKFGKEEKGQKFRQLRTRLHHVFICVAQTVNTYNF